jgi:acyl-coenzyme A synthetase/AMP-(fatty) acid ligase
LHIEEKHPAFWSHWGDEPFAVFKNTVISRLDFLYQAVSLSKQLPDHQYAINLCTDRYFFSLAFLAVLLKQQTNLLPPNNAPQSIRELSADYTDHYLLGDDDNTHQYPRYHSVSVPQNPSMESIIEDIHKLSITPDHLAAIAFTSGSTGKAKPTYKYWWQLVKETERTVRRFQSHGEPPQGVIATVPPQHIYGLQTTILFPLLGKSVLVSGATFFPNDIKETLENTAFPAILITTPIHLKTCIQSGLSFPDIDMIISATAPLDYQIAESSETLFNCPVMEIFGSTETGVIASRRTIKGSTWLLFDQVKARQEESGTFSIKGPHHGEWIELNDHLKIIDDQHFELIGRHSDMIKIAGKRASLSDLSIKLNSIEGVVDGVIFQKESNTSGIDRLTALVIAPELSTNQISHALKQMIDPVFLPRPIIKVDQLPRNKTGKLPYLELQKLYLEHTTND